jgi:hypothetical protein
MKVADLTRKLRCLLAVCGFMRPSDIKRTDLINSKILDSGALELKVLAPKEKRAGQSVIKSVYIQPHGDLLICPVATFVAYKALLASPTVEPVEHKRIKNLFYTPVIRHLCTVNRLVGSETIGHHIKTISLLINRMEGLVLAVGQSIGSSLAIEHGASLSEVQAPGFWAHTATFDSFYQLSPGCDKYDCSRAHQLRLWINMIVFLNRSIMK